jgi:ribosome-associated translation inhibitor RaiA
MKYNLELKGFEQQESSANEAEIRKLIERKISSLDKRFKAFPPDGIFLRVLVDKVAAHKLYHVSVTFDVPGATIAAKDQSTHIESAVSTAFAELERQLEEYLADRRGEPEWKRIARRKELRQRKVTP